MNKVPVNYGMEPPATLQEANNVAQILLHKRPLLGRKILMIVENLPVPFDRRVWQEAVTLRDAGALVSIICPTGKDYKLRYEEIDGINVYRHPLPLDAEGSVGYLIEYSTALFWEIVLAFRILKRHGFDVIHACNPPDLIFLIGLIFKPFGKKFMFDHHDINPELYEAKFGRRDFFYRLMLMAEKLTFKVADVSIATNDSYREIAISRGGMNSARVHVVRSGPNLDKLKTLPKNDKWFNGRRFLVGYVGVMGAQEGIELLLESVRYIVHHVGRKDIQFCLVGGGPALSSLKELAHTLEVQDYTTFTGRAPDHDLFEVLSSSDVCVNPDRVNPMNDKSTMNKILEYMAFSKPIVQFEVTEGRYSAGAASEYAKPNDTEDMANKILELLADTNKCREMGQLGRQRVETLFSWNHQVPNLIRAYEQILETT